MNAATKIAQMSREDADLWQPMPAGSTHTATGADKTNSVWIKTTTRVGVIHTSEEISLDNGAGFVPRGSLAVRFNPNILVPSRRAVLVLRDAGRVRRAEEVVTRDAGGLSDALSHAFLARIESVRNGDTTYTNFSLTANSDATKPFGPDSLLWLTGTRPADDDEYGVAYQYHPMFDMQTGPANMALTGDDGLLMPVTLPLIEKPAG